MTREEELKELKYREKAKVIAYIDWEDFPSDWVTCECPSCREGLSNEDKFAFCPHCGQKLDWSVLDD